VSAETAVKILVVDDEQGLRDLLSFELGLQGYKVSTASDGVLGVEKFRSEKFQLVVCDINMPKLSGLGVLAKLKEIDPDVKVIIISGTVEAGIDAKKKGAADFVRKPFDMDEFSALIKKTLEKSE